MHLPPIGQDRRAAGAPGLGPVSDAVLAAAGVDRLTVDVVDVFMQVMHRMKHHLHAAADELGMTPPMVFTLRMLEEPMAQRDIASAIGCDPSYVTGIVDRLEELQAVERVTDLADRRVKRIVLTEHGRELRATVATRVLGGLPFGDALDPAGRAQLLSLLRTVLGTEEGP